MPYSCEYEVRRKKAAMPGPDRWVHEPCGSEAKRYLINRLLRTNLCRNHLDDVLKELKISPSVEEVFEADRVEGKSAAV